MNIKKTELHQIEELSKIAKSSKAHWNYPEEWLKMWEEDLTISENYWKENEVFHHENEQFEITGFYTYKNKKNDVELDYFFIAPNFIGKGIGKILMNDFFERIKKLDIQNITLDADPNAEDFYKKFGFETIGQQPTKIEGRTLPKMIKKIN